MWDRILIAALALGLVAGTVAMVARPRHAAERPRPMMAAAAEAALRTPPFSWPGGGALHADLGQRLTFERTGTFRFFEMGCDYAVSTQGRWRRDGDAVVLHDERDRDGKRLDRPWAPPRLVLGEGNRILEDPRHRTGRWKPGPGCFVCRGGGPKPCPDR